MLIHYFVMEKLYFSISVEEVKLQIQIQKVLNFSDFDTYDLHLIKIQNSFGLCIPLYQRNLKNIMACVVVATGINPHGVQVINVVSVV